ncbi:unnamed protein product [Agarophyton chilense]|eukprot:gb/GEZJ01003672.1/.p1 GENE.gb/GEZJ01003672.1/~~gb/GEZJ01003672.1/.p1  ORF type:complete len:1539 (-),score=270.84 gb/GEZJ01003672.1/:3469-8085(-)
MPTEEQVSVPLGDEVQEEELPPPSPRHVFDDDVEMQSDLAPSAYHSRDEQYPAHAGDAHSATDDVNRHLSQNKSHPSKDDGRTMPSTSEPPAINPETETEANTQKPDQSSAPHHEHGHDDKIEQTQEQEAELTEQNSSTLFERILHKPARAPSLVSAWMSYVSINGPDAMASVVSLVISAARPITFAHEQLVTPEMIISNEPPASVTGMCQTMAVDAPERVAVLAKDAGSRRVRRAYEDFWRRMAAEAPDIVLYQTDCFDTLLPWLDAMSSSPIRALRLSACIAAYRLVDGFIEVNSQLRKHLTSIQRQLNTEKRRSGITFREQNTRISNTRGASAKAKKKELSVKGKELANRVDELAAKNGELTELSDRVYRTMFICRYRDISADVRSLSISALGGWIIMFPEQFLDDTHNKYIGWLLSDKDAGVRKTSLDVLQRMLRKKDYFENFETFLQRFSGRILEMAWDKDDLVAVTAIRLLNSLLPHNNNNKLLRPSHCESICGIALGDSHIDIRRAAGEFLASLVTMDMDDVAGSVLKPKRAYTKRGRPRSSSGPFNTLLREIPPVERSKDDIRELLYAIARKEDDHVDEALTVDAVWDHLPALRCWQAFDELLQESLDSGSPNENEEALSDLEKGVLCRMLLASAAEASGNGDSNRAKIVEKGEYADPDSPSVLLSRQFLPQLPRLLSQYQSDSHIACALIQLPRHFAMSIFEQQGQESYFSTMLERIIGVLMKHTGSEEVTAACAETLRYFLSDQNPLKKITCTTLQLYCQRSTKDLALQVRADLSKAEPENIAALVSQVRVLAELIDSGMTTYETVKEVLLFQEKNLESSELGDAVTIDAVRTACAFAVWSLSRIKSRLTSTVSSETPLRDVLDFEEVREYRTHGTNVVDVLQRICGNRSMAIPVRLISARCILIVLTLCRGIEKNTVMMIIRERSDPGNTSAAPDLDILRVKDSGRNLVEVISSVVFALVELELELHKNQISGRNRDSSLLNEKDRRDFFACLVQASLQSLLSKSISHLPLFGVLLKGGETGERGSDGNGYTTSRVCQDYLQQRQIRKTSLTLDIIKAIGELDRLNCPLEERQNLNRELAESCVSFRYRRDLKAKASSELLRALVYKCCSSKTGTDFFKWIEILSISSFAVVGFVALEDAQKLLEQMPPIDGLLAKYKDAADEKLLTSFDICQSSIHAVASGTTPELPQFSKMADRPAPGRRISSRRRKRIVKSQKSQTPLPEPSNVRKSSRVRKKVDYARMEKSESDEDSTEELGCEGEDEEKITSEPTVADVARNMMEYQNSPVARRKRASGEAPHVHPSPKRRRRNSEDNNNTLQERTGPKGRSDHRVQPSDRKKTAANHQASSNDSAEPDVSEQHEKSTTLQNSSEISSHSDKKRENSDAEESENEGKQSSAPRRRRTRSLINEDATGQSAAQSVSKQNGRRTRRRPKPRVSDVALKKPHTEPHADDVDFDTKKTADSEKRHTRSSRQASNQNSKVKSDAHVDADRIADGGKENVDVVLEKVKGKTTPAPKKGVVQRRKLRRW